MLAPDGRLIERQLATAEALPAAWTQAVTPQVVIVFHDQADLAMAFFVPPPALAQRGDGVPGRVADAAPPGLLASFPAAWLQPRPRLFLFAPYYLAADGLVPLTRMPVDVAEYYFHALLAARFALEASDSASDWQRWSRQRAELLMAEVPAAQRLTAYRAALSDFGAHLLSIINEIERLQHRRRPGGREICRLVGSPASLFGLWERSFQERAFAGHYPVASSSPDSGWSAVLEPQDKIAFVREVLGVAWSGEAATDFADFCGEPASG
ncbi:MAG: hypothetical protein AAF560_10895 [Acidobacteriota bacterium]